MKITMIYNTVYAFATQRNATQRNATQRNAYQNYILNNNFKFYIYQFFRALKNLSVFVRFAKIISFIKESTLKAGRCQILCSFLITKKNHAKGGQSSKINSFCQKEAKTTPFRIRNSLVKTMLLRVKRSNLFFVDCHDFLRSLAMTIKNNFAIFNYAFSCALKNKFEIISQLNYGFCYKNYFFNLNQVFRNSYDFGRDFDFGRNLNYGFEKNYNFGFGKNYFGNCNFGFDFGNEIYGIWHDLKGFLFNRKILKNKI